MGKDKTMTGLICTFYDCRSTIVLPLITLLLMCGTQINSDAKVLLGIDVLQKNKYTELSGMRLLLFTNSTGRNSDGVITAEVLANDTSVNLKGILIPEHGFYSSIPAGAKIGDDNLFGKPVYSLYNDIKKPGSKLLSECDAIVVDIQDIGVRSYTYISSLFRIMQAAAENKKQVIILDRPNPLGADIVDGNVLEEGFESFVGTAPIAYIHGLTIGELALMFNEEGWLGNGYVNSLKCDLTIIRMENYKRNYVWEETGLMWYPTSPNVPTVNSARGLAMLGIFGELGFISIGIGTTTPFQLLGSPDFNYNQVMSNVDGKMLGGINLSEVRFNPIFGMYSGKTSKGMFLNFYKDDNFMPFSAGIELILALRKQYPELFNPDKIKENSKNMFVKVTGTNDLFNALFNRIPDDNIKLISRRGLDSFLELRAKYLIYD
ncbi:MAG: DUF1343 domain-containing protein [Candidatus Kapaibacterium sp.]